MNNAKRLLMNTALLTVTAFVMRTVSVSFNVYLTNKIGADGIGLFQLIASVYAMASVFSMAGIKLASMRLVADSTVSNKHSHRRIMRRCLLYSLLTGIVVAAAMTGFADIIGTKWIGDSRSISSLKVLSLSLPFVSMSAALDGYFTSIGKLAKYTLVQFAEQVFKISVTVFTLKTVLSHGLEASCVAIVFGITSAEVFSLLCSYILYRMESSKNKKDGISEGIWKALLRISVPDCIGADMRSVLMTVEHLLIPIGFRKSGSNPSTSLATYGVIHGMSLPLVLYPSALLSSLSGLLVPEISRLHADNNRTRINYMTARVMHITLLFSIGTAGVMYFNAERLSLAVYGNNSCAIYMQIFAPLIPVMYTDMSVDGILKGLDQQMSYMRYNIIDASLCVALVYILVPIYSVKGYIVVVFISELVNFALSFNRLTIVADVKISFFRDIFCPALCVISTGFITKILLPPVENIFSYKATASVYIIFSITIYTALLIIFQCIDKEERSWIKNLISIKK